jgi:hypothetical protein
MRAEDHFIQGPRSWVHLHEKGGKLHSVLCHDNLDACLEDYITHAGNANDLDSPLFRMGKGKTENLHYTPYQKELH